MMPCPRKSGDACVIQKLDGRIESGFVDTGANRLAEVLGGGVPSRIQSGLFARLGAVNSTDRDGQIA